LQKTVLAIQQKIKHVIIILTDSNPELNNNNLKPENKEIRSTRAKHQNTDTHKSLQAMKKQHHHLSINQKKKKTSCKGLNFRYKKEAARERAKRSFVVKFSPSFFVQMLLVVVVVLLLRPDLCDAKRASERARIGGSRKATEEQQQWT